MKIRQGWNGRFFEDFTEGDVYRHPLGRTITATDNIWFTLLTMNTNPMHFDDVYASNSEFGQQLVNSTLSLAVVVGLSVTDFSQNALANLGWEEIELPHPVFVGDTLYAESLVLVARPSKSRPNVGIVTVRTRGLNQQGDVCVSFVRTAMIYKRGAEEVRSTFPKAKTPLDEPLR